MKGTRALSTGGGEEQGETTEDVGMKGTRDMSLSMGAGEQAEATEEKEV
jgi:hypothetical protein